MTEVERTSPLLNTPEAAALLRVPESWLEDKGREGKVPGRVKQGHYVLWHEPTLQRYIESLVQPANAVGRTELSKAQAAARRRAA